MNEGMRVTGAALVYRLYDIGYEISLDKALALLLPNSPDRARPSRGQAQALQINNPPISVALGTEWVEIGRRRVGAECTARIFDFGVVSLRLRIPSPEQIEWEEFAAFGNEVDVGTDLSPIFQRWLQTLLSRILPAVSRPAIAPITEDYILFRILSLGGTENAQPHPSQLSDDAVAQLLLNEHRPLSPDARRTLFPHRFSYYNQDLAILTWDNALIVDPDPDEADIQYVLEFANAQLLELRVYDALLDGQLPSMYARIADFRSRRPWWLRPRYARLLADLQTLVADSTEVTERVENSFKVTNDVYMAKIYSAEMEIFRAAVWRQGIDRKLRIIREAYEMLNAEAQASRAETLEVVVVILIVAELLIALIARH